MQQADEESNLLKSVLLAAPVVKEEKSVTSSLKTCVGDGTVTDVEDCKMFLVQRQTKEEPDHVLASPSLTFSFCDDKKEFSIDKISGNNDMSYQSKHESGEDNIFGNQFLTRLKDKQLDKDISNSEKYLLVSRVYIKEEVELSCEEDNIEDFVDDGISIMGYQNDSHSQTVEESTSLIAVPSLACSFYDEKQESSTDVENSINERFHKQHYEKQEEQSFGQHFLTHSQTVEESTSLIAGPSLACSFYDEKQESLTDVENSINERFHKQHYEKQEEQSFGQHFLTQCLEPSMEQDQNAKEQSKEEMVGLGLAELKNLSKDQTSCGRVGGWSSKPKDHKDGIQRLPQVDDKKRSRSRNSEKVCKQCGFTAIRWNDLYSHINKVHDEPISCQFCSYKTPNKSLLNVHTINKHSFGMSPIECPYCKHRSLSIMEIEDHIEKKHNTPKDTTRFTCPHCEHKSRSLGNMKYHIASKHTLEKNFICPYCGLKCILVHNVVRHVKTVHGRNINKDHPSLKIKPLST